MKPPKTEAVFYSFGFFMQKGGKKERTGGKTESKVALFGGKGEKKNLSFEGYLTY